MTNKYNIVKSITSCLKNQDVLLKLLLCSETEEGDVLDCQLCSSDEMSDDEKTEQFDDAQPIVHIGVYKLLILTLKSILLHVIMVILVRVLLKA